MPSERKTSTTADSKHKDSIKNSSDNVEIKDNIQMPVQQDIFEAAANASKLERMPTILKESIIISKVAPLED
jgi:hypothetical protein